MAKPPSSFTDSDYEAIAAAVEETVRGRWFLAEHARRTRHADTVLVLDAIAKLERALQAKAAAPEFDGLRRELVDMAGVIARTRREVAAIKPEGVDKSRIGTAANELDAIVESTERATSDILSAAEQIQEIAWTLRERGTDQAMCDQIDALTTDTYVACSFQDLTGQRIRKVIDALKFLERRLDAMVAIWRKEASLDLGAPVESAPAEMPKPAPAAPTAAPPANRTAASRGADLGLIEPQTPPPAAASAIESLSASERMALFS
jgi:chemotaxis regulatin CheY-phosphate phosphatase CheZ